jgi:C4-type Zn-finger protein
VIDVRKPTGERIECPSCASTDLRWSNKPHFLNFVMAFVFRDPIRCCACGFRFYRRALTDTEYADQVKRKREED